MKIKKTANLYRSIGGRANTSGIERVNRDGKMEVLQMGEAEVTPKERMTWNAKAKLDPRGRLPEEIYEVEKDDSGNPMGVDDKVRTRLPRQHQYSTEARLSSQRGDKPSFHKSTATSAQAHGSTDGMIDNNVHVDPANRKDTPKKKLASSDYRLANAFVKVSESLSVRDFLDSKSVAEISKASNVSVEDVLILEKIAKGNNGLSMKYKDIKGKCKVCNPDRNIPGNQPTDDGSIEHISPDQEDVDEESRKRHMNEVAHEVGLID